VANIGDQDEDGEARTAVGTLAGMPMGRRPLYTYMPDTFEPIRILELYLGLS